MSDHIAILKERIEKTVAKVQRYQKSLETAENELSDLQTALRVFEGLSNESEANNSPQPSTLERQRDIVRLLGVGGKNGRAPADLYASYCLIEGEDITIDTFRTTLWRMKGKKFDVDGIIWTVDGGDGEYWRAQVASSAVSSATDLETVLGQWAKEKEPTSPSAVGSYAGAGSAPTQPNPFIDPQSDSDW